MLARVNDELGSALLLDQHFLCCAHRRMSMADTVDWEVAALQPATPAAVPPVPRNRSSGPATATDGSAGASAEADASAWP